MSRNKEMADMGQVRGDVSNARGHLRCRRNKMIMNIAYETELKMQFQREINI